MVSCENYENLYKLYVENCGLLRAWNGMCIVYSAPCSKQSGAHL